MKPLDYLIFSFLFMVIHIVVYSFAGVVSLKISSDLYRESDRLLDYLRDMSDEEESSHVEKYFFPSQIIRGILLSLVLYPILGLLSEISFLLRFVFLTTLMFIYTDFASAVPFPGNIEGFVYMKSEYVGKESVWKLYFEMMIYSILFGVLAAFFLF